MLLSRKGKRTGKYSVHVPETAVLPWDEDCETLVCKLVFFYFLFKIVIDSQEVAKSIQGYPVHPSCHLPQWQHFITLEYSKEPGH